jgi:hypothetical protein
MKFFGEFVFRPGVQLQIKRTQCRHPLVQHLEHLIRSHSVGSDLEREVIGILHLFGDAVTQIAQRYQIRFQCRTRLLRCFPDRFALVEIDALLQFVVDLVYGDWLTVELELEPIEHRRLFCFCRNSLRHEIGICHRTFGRV